MLGRDEIVHEMEDANDVKGEVVSLGEVKGQGRRREVMTCKSK